MTDGVSCGDESTCIDIGRLWLPFEGDPVRDNGPCGVRGAKLALVIFHGDSGRGRSRETRAALPAMGASSLSPTFCGLVCSFTVWSEVGTVFRPSKWDLKDETGFYDTDSISFTSGSTMASANNRCAIRVFIIPSVHGSPIAIARADVSTGRAVWSGGDSQSWMTEAEDAD